MCDLSSLSKDELLELISFKSFNGLRYSVSDSDIKLARRNVLYRKGQRMTDESCSRIKKFHGPKDWDKYKAQMDKFDKGMALIDQANKLVSFQSS